MTTISSVQLVMSDCLRPHGRQHARLRCPSPTHGAWSDSRPLNQGCHPTISSSVIPFSSAINLSQHQFFPMSRLFASGSQSILFHFSTERDNDATCRQEHWASLVTQTVRNLPAMQETQVQSLGGEDPLEKGMATHSSILPWKFPWMEELLYITKNSLFIIYLWLHQVCTQTSL